MLRASSLAAVTILVCSTRLKPSSTAKLRTRWRTLTTSAPWFTDSVSVFVAGIRETRDVMTGDFAKENHAPLDVEGGAYAGQRKAELDEGDGDGRLHADDHRLRIEHAGHGRRVGQHAADEGVDDVQRGDVDQDSPRAVLHDLRGEIVLQC